MSSSSEHGILKPTKSASAGKGFATWSSNGIPEDNEIEDAKTSYQKLRDNYEHIGDAYDRNQNTANEWEIKDAGSKEMPYLTHVKSLTPTWKTLRYLCDWMEVGTTPLRWREIRHTPEHTRRINKTAVTYIEYNSAVASKSRTIDSPAMLKDILYSSLSEPKKHTDLRLFIVEDLSQQVIELLGARFDIDPMFFRDHVDDYVWHNVRDPWAQPPSLLSNMTHRQWFHLRNMRVRYYETQAEFGDAWVATNK